MLLRIISGISQSFFQRSLIRFGPQKKRFIRPIRISMVIMIQMILIGTSYQVCNFESHKKKEDQLNQNKNSEQVFKIPQIIKKNIRKQKMILVMDLDETMVQTRKVNKPKHNNYQQVNIQEDIVYVEYRPYLKQFLAAASQIFTIYVYTAGTQTYADKVLDSIPNNSVIKKRFYRESCIPHKGTLIKDLKKIRKQIKKGAQKVMILVDDNSCSTRYNHPNSLKIKIFSGDQNDKSLLLIFSKLLEFYIKEIQVKQ